LRDPERASALRSVVAGSGGDVLAPGTEDELRAAAESLRRSQCEIVAINGGDGTLHRVLTALWRVFGASPLPRVALLRGGTMNTVANALGIRGGSESLLKRLVAKLTSGYVLPAVRRELLAIGDAVGLLFGSGAIAGFLRLYYETESPGPLAAARVLGHGIVSSVRGGAYGRALENRWHGRVTVDGREWSPTDYLAVGAGAIDQIGLGFRPYPRAGSLPGKFAALGIHTSASGFVTDLPLIWRGKPMRTGKALDEMVTELRMRALGPFDYIIDGDLYRCSGELVVRTGPPVEFILF
jgi:diacylglycerol kinase family enzyme